MSQDKSEHTHSLLQHINDVGYREDTKVIRKVAIVMLCVNLSLMLVKLIGGIIGQSEALTADGYHSLTDSSSDIILLIFTGIAIKSSDKRYPYGYGKFETLAAFIISLGLLAVAVHIAYDGVESIISFINGQRIERPNIIAVIVIIVSIITKECLFRYAHATGKRTGSLALISNAWHHRSDAMAGVATLAGVGGAYLFGKRLTILDPIASLIISVFIIIPALKMFRKALGDLMDKGIDHTKIETFTEEVSKLQGVESVVQVRSRKSGRKIMLDIVIDVQPDLTARELTGINTEIRNMAITEFGMNTHVMIGVNTQIE